MQLKNSTKSWKIAFLHTRRFAIIIMSLNNMKFIRNGGDNEKKES